MHVLVRCSGCDAALPVIVGSSSGGGVHEAAGEVPGAIKCGRCGRESALSFTDDVRADRAVDRCPVCAGSDFYTRKDFNPKVGLTVVAVGALISAAFYWLGRDVVAYAILAAAALLDLIVYGRLRDLTVCYRCHSEFRGEYVRSAGAFDLHTADVLEVEYQRRVGKR